MFDEVTRDILTIISILLTIVLGIFALDKEKKSQLKELLFKVLIIVTIVIHLFNLINFFLQEISHITIFSLVLSITTLMFMYLLYMMNLLRNLQNNDFEHTKMLLELVEHTTYFNTKQLIKGSEKMLTTKQILEKTNKNEYSEEIKKILENYK